MPQLPVLVQAVVRTVYKRCDLLIAGRLCAPVDDVCDMGRAPLAREEGHVGVFARELRPRLIFITVNALRVATLFAEHAAHRSFSRGICASSTLSS